jgi:hypothetical protein
MWIFTRHRTKTKNTKLKTKNMSDINPVLATLVVLLVVNSYESLVGDRGKIKIYI